MRTLQLIEVTVPRSPRLRTGGAWSWRHAVWFQKLNGIMPTKVCWKLWRFQKHRRLILCLGLFCRTTLESTSYLHLPNLAFLAGPLPRPQWTLGSSQLLMLLFLTVLDHGHFWLQDLGGHCCDLSLWHHWYLIYRYYPHWGEMLPPNLWWGSIQTLFTFISCQWEFAATLLLGSKRLGRHLAQIPSGCCFSLFFSVHHLRWKNCCLAWNMLPSETGSLMPDTQVGSIMLMGPSQGCLNSFRIREYFISFLDCPFNEKCLFPWVSLLYTR